MLLNFESLMTKTFSPYYALNNYLSFPLQVSSIRHESQTEAIKTIQSEHYKELKQFIEAYRGSLEDNIYYDSRYCFRVFLIPQVGNHHSSSDCAVEFLRFDPNNPTEFESVRNEITLIKE